MTERTHRAWLLDLDGTLYRPTPLKLGMALELATLGASHLRLIQAFRRSHEHLREELRDQPDRKFDPSPYQEQIHRTAAVAGTREEHVRQVVREWMEERPGKWIRRARRSSLIQELSSFVAAGGKAAVVSDYPAERKLAALEVTHLFSAVVANGEHPALRRLKPAPDGYLLAAEELGVAPRDCLVIGDRQDADGAAAAQAGMAFRLIS